MSAADKCEYSTSRVLQACQNHNGLVRSFYKTVSGLRKCGAAFDFQTRLDAFKRELEEASKSATEDFDVAQWETRCTTMFDSAAVNVDTIMELNLPSAIADMKRSLMQMAQTLGEFETESGEWMQSLQIPSELDAIHSRLISEINIQQLEAASESQSSGIAHSHVDSSASDEHMRSDSQKVIKMTMTAMKGKKDSGFLTQMSASLGANSATDPTDDCANTNVLLPSNEFKVPESDVDYSQTDTTSITTAASEKKAEEQLHEAATELLPTFEEVVAVESAAEAGEEPTEAKCNSSAEDVHMPDATKDEKSTDSDSLCVETATSTSSTNSSASATAKSGQVLFDFEEESGTGAIVGDLPKSEKSLRKSKATSNRKRKLRRIVSHAKGASDDSDGSMSLGTVSSSLSMPKMKKKLAKSAQKRKRRELVVATLEDSAKDDGSEKESDSESPRISKKRRRRSSRLATLSPAKREQSGEQMPEKAMVAPKTPLRRSTRTRKSSLTSSALSSATHSSYVKRKKGRQSLLQYSSSSRKKKAATAKKTPTRQTPKCLEIRKKLAWYRPSENEKLTLSVACVPEYDDLHVVRLLSDEVADEEIKLGDTSTVVVYEYLAVQYPDAYVKEMSAASASSSPDGRRKAVAAKRRRITMGVSKVLKKAKKKVNTRADDYIIKEYTYDITPANLLIRDWFRLIWLPFWQTVKSEETLNEYMRRSAAYVENCVNKWRSPRTDTATWKPKDADTFAVRYTQNITVRFEVYFNARSKRLPICVDIVVKKKSPISKDTFSDLLTQSLLRESDTSAEDSSNDATLIFDGIRYRNAMAIGSVDSGGNLKLIFSESSSGHTATTSIVLHFGLAKELCVIPPKPGPLNDGRTRIDSAPCILERVAVWDIFDDSEGKSKVPPFDAVIESVRQYIGLILAAIESEFEPFKVVFSTSCDPLCWNWPELKRDEYQSAVDALDKAYDHILRIAFLVDEHFFETVYKKWNAVRETPIGAVTSHGLPGLKRIIQY